MSLGTAPIGLLALAACMGALGTASCGVVAAAGAPEAQSPSLPAMSEYEFGKLLVKQRCANCHAIEEGDDRFAAPLHHLYGRQAGRVEGFTFSVNIKSLGIAWSPSALDSWLASTTFDTPDIRMRHVGVPNKEQRAAILTYLETLPGNDSSGRK
jgi:cytochrome c